MALKSPVSSGLNPNAPLFVPYSYQIVEDFSPDWWKLVETSPAFREYWLCQRLPALEKEEELPLPDDAFPSADVEDLVGNPLNEDDILDDIWFIEDLQPPVQEDSRKLSDSVALGMKDLSASLKLAGTMGAKMWLKHEPLVYFGKPPKLLPDVPRKSAIRRIQQPR